MSGPARVVVAGAGLAGLRTIEELRGRGYDGAITLVGAESRPPYDRPPLSKKLMIGALDDTSLRAELDSLAVDVRLGERAVGLTEGLLATDRGRTAVRGTGSGHRGQSGDAAGGGPPACAAHDR